jgi:hypothetical protein
MTPEQSQRYGGLVQAITAQTASFTASGLPADTAAKVIAKGVTARKPRTRYTIGRDAALLTLLAHILSDRYSTASLPPLCLPQGEQMKHHDSATALATPKPTNLRLTLPVIRRSKQRTISLTRFC